MTPDDAATHPPRPLPGRADQSRARTLASLLYRLDVHRRAIEHSSPLGVAEGRLLWLLSDRRPRTLREISEAIGLEQSTVNRQVNGALDAGLLRRSRQQGRAAWLIEPTDEGLQAYESATATVLGAYEDGLSDLGDDGAGQLLDLLDRFVGEPTRGGQGGRGA